MTHQTTVQTGLVGIKDQSTHKKPASCQVGIEKIRVNTQGAKSSLFPLFLYHYSSILLYQHEYFESRCEKDCDRYHLDFSVVTLCILHVRV
jgi:hypothetical protein